MTDRQRYRELYWCWKAMKQRCLNPRCRAYRNYGERGITICDEWMEFEPFLAWALSNGWEKGLEIDRVDNDGGYSPENCRFVTRTVNGNNRRTNVFLCVNGKSKTISEWARISGIGKSSINSWIRKHGSEYAVNRVSEALAIGYVEGDYGRNHKTIPVVHVESGTRFSSISRAAHHFGINTGQLYNAVKYGHNTRAGHFITAGVN